MIPHRVVHIGSYFQGKNDIVQLMANRLEKMSKITVFCFDPEIYGKNKEKNVIAEGNVNWLRDDVIENVLSRFPADTIICNAGGLSPSPEMHKKLSLRGIQRIGIALSDPDDFTTRSKYFSSLFDRFYTNAEETIPKYRAIGVQADLLPFAADPEFHIPMGIATKYEIVVVGANRPERTKMAKSLRHNKIRVGCFGRGWRSKLFEKIGFSTEVHGEAQVRAINSARLYLSFAETKAGFTNVKVGVFEAAACERCVLVKSFSEMNRYFEPGKEIVTFTDENDAIRIIKDLSVNWQKAMEIGKNARKKILSHHCWEHRWEKVLGIK